MSQLVPYHLLNSEQDDSLMFATMFDYQNEEYNKPEVSLQSFRHFLGQRSMSFRDEIS